METNFLFDVGSWSGHFYDDNEDFGTFATHDVHSGHSLIPGDAIAGTSEGDELVAADGNSAVDSDPLPGVQPIGSAPHVGAVDSAAGMFTSDTDDYTFDVDGVLGNMYSTSENMGRDDSWIVLGIGEDVLGMLAETGTFSDDINSASNVAIASSNQDQGPHQALDHVAHPTALAEEGPTDDGLAAVDSAHVGAVAGAAESMIMENDVNYTTYNGGDVDVYWGNSTYTSDPGDDTDPPELGLPGDEPGIPEGDPLIAAPHVIAVDSAGMITSGSSSSNLTGDEGSSPVEFSQGNADSAGEAQSATSNRMVNLHGDSNSVLRAETVPVAGPTNGRANSSGGCGKRPARPTRSARAGKKLKKMVAGKIFKYHGIIERAGCHTAFKAYFRPSSLPDSDHGTCILGEFPSESEAWWAFNLMAFVHEGKDACLNDPDIGVIVEEAAAWLDCHRVALLAHLRLRGRGTYTHDNTTPYYRSIKCSESSKGRITYSCNVTLNPGVVDPNRQAVIGEKEKQTFDSAEEAARLADWRKYLNEGEAAWTNFSLAIYKEQAGVPLDKTWLPLTNDPKKYLSTSKRGR